MTRSCASNPSFGNLIDNFEEWRESRKFKEPIEKLLRPENIQLKQSSAGEIKTNEAIKVLREALQECGIENEIASYIKRKFDDKFGPVYSCVVGRNFGAIVDSTEFIHLNVSKISVLIFKMK